MVEQTMMAAGWRWRWGEADFWKFTDGLQGNPMPPEKAPIKEEIYVLVPIEENEIDNEYVKAVNNYQSMQDVLVDVWFHFSASDDPTFRKMAEAARALIPDPVGSPAP